MLDKMKVQALVDVIGADLTAKMLEGSGYDITQTEKSTDGVRYKVKGPASSSIRQAMFALEEAIDAARTGYPDATLIAAIDDLAAQFEEPSSGWKRTGKETTISFWDIAFAQGARRA